MSKDVIVYNESTSKERKEINPRWWDLSDNVHEHLFPLVQRIENRQSYKRVRSLRHARLYSNLEVLGLQAGLFSRTYNEALLNQRVTFNVVKSCIDTAASKIAKMKPRPMFLTIGGDDKLQRNAKNLTLFMDGAFEAAKVYVTMQRGFTDAGVFGTGETFFYKQGNRVMCERVVDGEIIVDDTEGLYGEPRTKYRSKFVSRDTLCKMFPKHQKQIRDAHVGMGADWYTEKEFDRIRVIEAWSLPSVPGAKDGKHCIVISNADLLVEGYKYDYFPFVTQRWNYKLTGYEGQGIAEELTGIQLEINKLLRTIQLSLHYCAVPRVFVEANSQVNTKHLNNEIAGIVKYIGTPPQFYAGPVLPAEVYAHLENLVRKAYELIGISMLSAQSKKPAGLDSGQALREFNDIESDRFQLVGQRYEEAHMEAARIMFDLYKEIQQSGQKIELNAVDGKNVKKIDWDDIDLSIDQCVLRVFPTSLLPTQPAGKLQKVQELMQAGLVDRETGLKLLDFPDIEGAMSIRLAAVKNAEAVVTKILEEGVAITPEPYMDLQYAKKYAQNSLLKAQVENVSEEKIDRLREFIDGCQSLIQQAMAPQPQAEPAPEPGMDPMAAPEAPPVSDLIENLPAPGVA